MHVGSSSRAQSPRKEQPHVLSVFFYLFLKLLTAYIAHAEPPSKRETISKKVCPNVRYGFRLATRKLISSVYGVRARVHEEVTYIDGRCGTPKSIYIPSWMCLLPDIFHGFGTLIAAGMLFRSKDCTGVKKSKCPSDTFEMSGGAGGGS